MRKKRWLVYKITLDRKLEKSKAARVRAEVLAWYPKKIRLRVSFLCHSSTIFSLLLPFNWLAKSSQLLCSYKFSKVVGKFSKVI